jgi:hypothetical protein
MEMLPAMPLPLKLRVNPFSVWFVGGTPGGGVGVLPTAPLLEVPAVLNGVAEG